MTAPLLLTSGPARCEAEHRSCGTSPVCLFYAIAIVFHICHGGDMMYEMRARKFEPTLLTMQGIFNPTHHLYIWCVGLNIPHHIFIYMVWEELAFDDAVSYTHWWKSKLAEVMAWELNHRPSYKECNFLFKVRHSNHTATEDATMQWCTLHVEITWPSFWLPSAWCCSITLGELIGLGAVTWPNGGWVEGVGLRKAYCSPQLQLSPLINMSATAYK